MQAVWSLLAVLLPVKCVPQVLLHLLRNVDGEHLVGSPSRAVYDQAGMDPNKKYQ